MNVFCECRKGLQVEFLKGSLPESEFEIPPNPVGK